MNQLNVDIKQRAMSVISSRWERKKLTPEFVAKTISYLNILIILRTNDINIFILALKEDLKKQRNKIRGHIKSNRSFNLKSYMNVEEE